MEMRYSEVDRARAIYERYVRCIPDVKAWVRYAKFEMQVGHVDKARGVYERAVQELDGEPSIVRAYFCLPRAAGMLGHWLRCS
jgi:crooked neck